MSGKFRLTDMLAESAPLELDIGEDIKHVATYGVRWDIQHVVDYVRDIMLDLGTDRIDMLETGLIREGMPSIPPFSDMVMEFDMLTADRKNTLRSFIGIHQLAAEFVPEQYRPGSTFVAYHCYDAQLTRQGITHVSTPACIQWVFNPQGTVSAQREFLTEDISGDDVAANFGVATLALTFSHCRNVEVVDRLPSRQERRELDRQGKPVRKWGEIVIDPARTRFQPQDATERLAGDHPARIQHLCRGHFAQYSAERPLFGRHVGTFWVPPHVRGSDEVGTKGND